MRLGLLRFIFITALLSATPSFATSPNICERWLTEAEVIGGIASVSRSPKQLDVVIDRFTAANDEALKAVFDYVAALQSSGMKMGARPQYEILKKEAAELLNWADWFAGDGWPMLRIDALALRERFEVLERKLERTRDVQEALNIASAKSKSKITLETIDTYEEFIRYVHEKAVKSFNELIFRLATRQNEEATSLAIWRDAHVLYVGTESASGFDNQPMGAVYKAVSQYFTEHSTWIRPDLFFFTDRSFYTQAKLGEHFYMLRVIYEPALGNEHYVVHWSMNEPGFSDKRIRYVSRLFPKFGLTHTARRNHHEAVKRVSVEDLNYTLKAILFSTENLRNIDLGMPPRFSSSELAHLFESWFRFHEIKQGRLKREDFVDHDDVKAKMEKRPDWGPRQKKILEIFLHDSFPTSHELLDRRKDVIPPLGVMLGLRIQEFFPKGVTVAEVQTFYREAIDVYFTSFEVRDVDGVLVTKERALALAEKRRKELMPFAFLQPTDHVEIEKIRSALVTWDGVFTDRFGPIFQH